MLKKMTMTLFGANCYLLYREDQSQALIIDPGSDAKRITRFLKEHQLTLTAICLTHGHIDHIGAVQQLKDQFPNTTVYIHQEDAMLLRDPRLNLSAGMLQSPYVYHGDVQVLQADDVIDEAGYQLICRHFPGHTPGSCMFELKEDHCLFSGDVLFAGSIGRYDLPLGNRSDTRESIKKMMNLHPAYVLYPGHGETSTIAHEFATNPYLIQQ